MNYRTFFTAAIIFVCATCLLLAQPAGQAKPAQQPAQSGAAAAPAQAASSTPVAKQPVVKSKEEGDAVAALIAAVQNPDPDARIKAGETVLQKFPDSDFKPLALFFITASYSEKNDYEKTIAYGEMAIKADPANYQAMLILARLIAARTRENDLDKEEKLTTAEKYANQALTVLKTAPRPNPTVTDEQWAEAKKSFEAQAYEAFAFVAMGRNKTDVAIDQYKKSIETSPGDPTTLIRLGNALAKAGKYDEAMATLQKVMDMPEAPPNVKQIAQAERVRAFQAKEQAAKK